ncbi:mitochondrial carnitine/acylcarnitine carrier protein [Venturia nashicola]|uniref:Mitochondrial carnitine/acylcarnitine carrier protein n=1 Tax=Venturia nashicola TaxID=86259 RepID=A0A4Z1NY03_9PEZI|nr:mitochondrial carnitine/acylcarnitine carrier protein [Venturia nashicola]TLD28000.1 mitochondrial carnitine/acylcarnitine carrier protein [Venturia nashicola]
MSATVKGDLASRAVDAKHAVSAEREVHPAHWKGFVAGVFSGVAKLTVGHPFDTIKVRLQTTEASHFKGPLDCLLQTVRNEGIRALYKGASPPLVGWMFMDSLMLGSLTAYRRILREHLYTPKLVNGRPDPSFKLPAVGHGLAGMLAGFTVSFIAAPIEHVKARLQVQYATDKSKRLYSGPIDCTKKIFNAHGIRGLYHGLSATMLFRGFFFFWWSTYDIFTRKLTEKTNLSTPAINFWAGGLSAQVFWITSYPGDVIKQRIMTDPLEKDKRKYWRWQDAATQVYREAGLKGYWRGFVPCFLRAFPANACALVAFEGVMRTLK